MENDPLNRSAQRVQEALDASGIDLQVMVLPNSTRTALEAAEAIGVQVGQIVKSLVFKGKRSEKPILALVSGENRVDEPKLEALIGEPLGRANADFVREHTGFAIGGVPPIGHSTPLQTYVDRDLLQYNEIWAAAGTPNAVFRLTPQQLLRLVEGKVVELS